VLDIVVTRHHGRECLRDSYVLPPNRSAHMPRYFFNIHDGKNVVDREGTELADLAEARLSAVELAGRSIAEIGDAFWTQDHDWRLEVLDASGKLLFTLNFSASKD
jgi:hypothetical protein